MERSNRSEEKEVWGVEEGNLSTASYYGGRYSQSQRVVQAGPLMLYYLWNYLVFYKSFFKTGARAANRPVLVITLVVLFAAALSGGIFMRVSNSDPEVLNLSEESPFVLNKHLYEESFEEKHASIIFAPKEEGANLLTKATLLEMMSIYEAALEVQVEKDDVTYSYQNMCVEALGSCVTYGILGFWDFDRAQLEAQDEGTIGQVVGSSGNYTFGVPIELGMIASGVEYSGNEVTSVDAFKMVLFLKHDFVDDWSKIERDWQKKFVELMEEQETNNFDVKVLTTASRDFENYSELDGDWGLIVAGWILMIVFGGLAMFRGNIVKSRSMLILAAVVHSLMAYSVSTGLSGYMGTYDVPANRFVILITFFFALNHVFMLARNFERSDPNEPFDVRIAIAEQHSGMQLFLVGLNVFVSYMAGSLYPLEGFHSFCLRLGLCIMMEQQFFLTWFCAWLGIDVRRSEANRIDCFPCVKLGSKQEVPRKTRQEVFKEDTILSKFYKAFLQGFCGKFLVILLTIGMFGAGMYGMISWDSTEKFDLKSEYPEGSSGEGYVIADQLFFDLLPTPVYIVLNQVDYNDPETALIIEELISNSTSSEYFLPEMFVDWYSAYMDFKQEGDFYNDLDAFLLSPEGLRYNIDIVRDGSGMILTSRFTTFTNPNMVGSRFTDLKGHLEGREDLEERIFFEGVDSFAYTADWAIFVSYPKVKAIIYEAIVVSILTLTGMEAIFVPPSIVLSIFLSAILATVNMIGFFNLVGLGINSYTGYWIFLAWGLSSDYVINFLYDFMSIPGTDKDYRAERALTLGSTSIFPSAIIAIFSVIPMVFGSSPLTYTFPFGIWTCVFFAVWNAWVFLPVVHSLFGSRSINNYSFDSLPCV